MVTYSINIRGIFEHGSTLSARFESHPLLPTTSPSKPSPVGNVQIKRTFHTSPPRRLRVENTDTPATTADHDKKHSPSSFSYAIAAAYCGKQRKFNSTEYYHSVDPYTLKKYTSGKPSRLSEIRTKSGQDACFIAPIGTTGAIGLGVADGVGGWIEQKIDSAEFAHGLCHAMSDACERYPATPRVLNWSGNNPRQLLQLGYDDVCADESVTGGGSTACLGIAGSDGSLQTANLGDSGYIHIRLRQVLHVSEHQTHAFNTPYQMSRIPNRVFLQMQRFGGNAPISDTPIDAATMNHKLQHGDVVIFATDGVWDNLTSQDLLEIVSDKMSSLGAWSVDSKSGAARPGRDLRQLAKEPVANGQEKSIQSAIAVAVVEKAKAASNNPRRESPFSRAVQKHFPGERHVGGKVDDICVVALVALEARDQ